MYAERNVRISSKRTGMRKNMFNADKKKGNIRTELSLTNRNFLENPLLNMKKVKSNKKLLKNNIDHQNESTERNSENEVYDLEKPVLNSIDVTATIQTAIEKQINDDYYKSISLKYDKEAEIDKQRNILEHVKLNQIFEGERLKERRILEEEEMFERAYIEDVQRKQSILRDSHRRHEQAQNKKISELYTIKQEEELVQRKRLLRKEQEERTIRKLEDEIVVFQNHLSAMMSTIKQNMSQEACMESMAIQQKAKKQIGKLGRGYSGGGENLGGSWAVDGFGKDGLEGKVMGSVGSRMNQCMQLNALYKDAATQLELVIAKESEKRKEMAKATTINPVTTNLPKQVIPCESINKITLSQCQTSYLNHLKRRQEILEKCKELNSDPKYKRYRFDLTAAVGRVVSTLNSHTNSQPSTIIQLLEGNSVVCSGKQRVSSKDHPSAALFCMDKLAKKIVEQATETSKINTPLYVALALEVAASKPAFVPILLTHFALVCPVTVPFHSGREGQTEEEYYRLLGYAVDDRGIMEDENTFLSRVSGYVVFFAALMLNGKMDGLSLKDMWVWLARVFNQAPIPGVTATALHKVLTIIDNRMLLMFKRQYIKMLRFLDNVYLSKIDKISDSDKKAPVIRLQSFVSTALKSGGIGGS